MATFPSVTPSYGVEKKSAPNVHAITFGDGYEQRLTWGLNQNLKIWNVEFRNITEASADTVETFLDARIADNAPFDWTPPGESAASKYVCASWSKRLHSKGVVSIKGIFYEVAEP